MKGTWQAFRGFTTISKSIMEALKPWSSMWALCCTHHPWQITRSSEIEKILQGENYKEWELELISELELGEEHCTISKTESSQHTCSDKDKKKRWMNWILPVPCWQNWMIFVHIVRLDMPTTSALQERRELLFKCSRCFFCAHKWHISNNCNCKLTCSICKGKHHVLICYSHYSTNGGQFSHAHNGDCNDLLNSDCASKCLVFSRE